MRDDELRVWLRQRNPWWRPGPDTQAWTRHVPTLRAADTLGIDYRASVLDDVVDGGLYVIRGPRRVGKSVALKRFAADVLRRPGVQPTQVIYMSLDEFDQKTLRRALILARDMTGMGDAPRYWLI